MAWHFYKNGNYQVMIDDVTGTKVRDSGEANEFLAEFPESIDLNITDACSVGCSFCYRSCVPTGKHATVDDVRKIIETMVPWTEVALGGGSPIEHPQIEDILNECSDNELIANMTVHSTHFMEYFEKLYKWNKDRKLYGIGCSINRFDPLVARHAKLIPTTVLHTIAGVISPEDLDLYLSEGLRVLILGYKNMGRAETESLPNLDKTKEIVEKHVKGKGDRGGVISFDNLALDQLDVKSMLTEARWRGLYMGDDGVDGKLTSASMYVDAVAHTYSRNSLKTKIHEYDPDNVPTVKQMYQELVDHE
jgi:hypothetical protein